MARCSTNTRLRLGLISRAPAPRVRMAAEAAAVALGSLGAGAVLFVGTGMLCTAAMLSATKGKHGAEASRRRAAAASAFKAVPACAFEVPRVGGCKGRS